MKGALFFNLPENYSWIFLWQSGIKDCLEVPASPTKNKTVLCGFFSLQRKKGVNGYVIARKVSFYTIFTLQPKFTLVYTLFLMVTLRGKKIPVYTLFPKKGKLIFGSEGLNP